MSAILVLLYLITIILCFLRPKSKIVVVLAFIVTWVLIAGNYDNADYDHYLIRYDRGLDVFVDFGFSSLCNFFNRLGYDYQTFKGFISFICLLFVFRTISKFCKDVSFGIALFLIFPFIVDITQFRNFVAYSIVFLGMPSLFEEGKRGVVKFLIFVVLASTIHSSSVFYAFFALSKFRIKWWQIGFTAVIIYFSKEVIKLYFAQMLETDKLEFFEKTSILGALFGAIVVLITISIIWFVNSRQKGNYYAGNKLPYKFCSKKTWVYCNMTLIILIPFLFDNANYSRVHRNIAVLNMIFIYNAYYINKNIKILLMCGYYAYFVFSSYLAGNYIKEVLYPVFTYNSIL